MSYLLKALEKAELERKQLDVSPEVVPSTVVVSKGLPLSVVVVLVVAVVLMLWKLMPVNDDASVVEEHQEELGLKVAKSERAPEEVKDVNPQEKNIVNNTSETTKSSALENSEMYEQGTFDVPKDEIKQLEQLSKEVLQLIPSLQLESHIYSSAEEFRSVVINGRSFKQGQFVSIDVVLEQITEDGIVINVASQLIALPKGISWVASNAQ